MFRLSPRLYRTLTAALFCIIASPATQADVLPNAINKNTIMSLSLTKEAKVKLIRCHNKGCKFKVYSDVNAFSSPFAVMIMHRGNEWVRYAFKTPDGAPVEFSHPITDSTSFHGHYDATITTANAVLR